MKDPVGGVVGAFVTLGFAVAFIGREFVHVQRTTQTCVQLELACHFTPEPYTRFFLYVGIGMCQAIILFMVGARFDDARREAAVAPEWRR